MQIKKSREADLERKKPTLLLIGMVMACAVVLSAFEWRTFEEESSWDLEFEREISDFEDEPILISFVEKKKPKPVIEESKRQVTASIIHDFSFLNDDLPFEDDYLDEPLEPVVQDIELPEEIVGDEEPILVPDEMPQFPGGELERQKFLSANVTYLPMARDAGISGRVFVQFTVEKDGTISDIEVVKGLGGGLDEEAVRAVEAMPKWEPGFYQGRPVSVRFVMPIFFNLVK
jgi:protein TonB